MHSTHLRTIIFVVGVLLGVWVGFRSLFSTEVLIMSLGLVVLMGMMLVIKHFTKSSAIIPVYACIVSCGIALGVMRVQFVPESQILLCEKKCELEVMVVRSPEQKEIFQYVTVQYDDDHEYIRLRLPLFPTYAIGDTLRIEGVIKEPEMIFPHGDKKSFDYVSYLATRNIGSESYFPDVKVIDTQAQTFAHKLGRLRETMVASLETYIQQPASSLASGMLFGKSAVSPQLIETFRVVGLSHIVVLSGFNIVIIISSILALLAYVPLLLRVLIASSSVVMFVIMVGGEASVIRATMMAGIALCATVLGRAYIARQALVVSLFAIVMYEPFALMSDVSLHLSFIATAGIVYLSEIFSRYLTPYIRQKSLCEIIATTLSAYVMTLPYLMHVFGTVSLYALIANVLVVPVVPLAMLASFLVVVLSLISETLALGVGFLTTQILDVCIFIATTLSRLPYASIGVTISYHAMLFFYSVIAIIFLWLHHRKINETPDTKRNDDEEIYTY